MGIDGLLQLLKPITQKQHLSTFKGLNIGVDISPWLYKGCYQYAMQLTDQYVSKYTQQTIQLSALNYIQYMTNLLEYYEIKPYFVFDGRSLSMKKQTISKREKTKQSYVNKINFQDIKKSQDFNIIRKCLGQSISITDKIVSQIINFVKQKKMNYIVSPYESDSQLAKLKKLNLIDAVITQDSDLLVYGCNTIFKLNQDGECDYIDYQLVQIDAASSQYLQKFMAMGWYEKTLCCILAGCDYVDSIKGIGLKKAIKTVNKIQKMQNGLKFLKQDSFFFDKIDQQYIKKVENSMIIFKHALTYNPINKQLEPLNQVMENENILEQITGNIYKEYYQLEIYNGKYDAKTLKQRHFSALQKQNQIQLEYLNLEEIENKRKLIEDQKQKCKEEKQLQRQNNMLQAFKQCKPISQPKLQKKSLGVSKLNLQVNNILMELISENFYLQIY